MATYSGFSVVSWKPGPKITRYSPYGGSGVTMSFRPLGLQDFRFGFGGWVLLGGSGYSVSKVVST